MGSATRDLPILTVYALHVARGEEDIHNSLFAGDGWLLASVDNNGRDMYPVVVHLAPAEAPGTVDVALAGAEITGRQSLKSIKSVKSKVSRL